MKLLTAKKGEPHFTSNHFRAMLESVFGNGSYVSEIYEGLAPELSANNIVKIHSGILIHHGGLFLIEPGTYDEVNYMNGTQSMKRIDLIVARYTKNRDTGYEDCEWVIVQGEPAQVDPVAPSYESGNMQNGDFVDDCPVFAIHLDGLNVTKVEQLLEVSPNMDELSSDIAVLKDKSTRENILWSASDAVYTGTLELSDDLFKYKHLVFMRDDTVIYDVPVIQGMTGANDASSSAMGGTSAIVIASLNLTNITATSVTISSMYVMHKDSSVGSIQIGSVKINKIVGIQ